MSRYSARKPGSHGDDVAYGRSDNFDHTPGSHRVDFRTGVVLGTVYRLDDGQNFVSLANTIRAFYQVHTADSQIGFANLILSAGYQLPPLSFGLTDSFVRDDNTAQLLDASFALLRTRQKFIRNSILPRCITISRPQPQRPSATRTQWWWMKAGLKVQLRPMR
jgi:hypothetical protein